MMTGEAGLHPMLARDTRRLGETGLSHVRWMNDRRFPWLMLVPRRPDLLEWHHLPPQEQHQLLDEVSVLSAALETVTAPDKINVGALGNLVPQLHVHVIARHRQDPCWPGPVWGNGTPEPFADDEQPQWLSALLEALPANFLDRTNRND
jgi:diadenosine tetraphosphate (Ap4A) HIT family hydrolase